MDSGQEYINSELTVGMLNNTMDEVHLQANYEGLLMTESPKGDGAFDTIEKSPKNRSPGVQESLMMQGLL
jgi:hypothetical protein